MRTDGPAHGGESLGQIVWPAPAQPPCRPPTQATRETMRTAAAQPATVLQDSHGYKQPAVPSHSGARSHAPRSRPVSGRPILRFLVEFLARNLVHRSAETHLARLALNLSPQRFGQGEEACRGQLSDTAFL